MKYWYEKPHVGLSDFVRTVLIIEGFSHTNYSKVPLFTRGMPALVCKTENGSSRDAIAQVHIYGKAAPDDSWIADECTTIIGYFFNPFSLSVLFDLPAQKLATGFIDLGDWDQEKTHSLLMRLSESKSSNSKVDALNQLLITEAKRNQKHSILIRYATDQMLHNSNPEVLGEILMELNLNERTFQRIFKKYVGITPNHYRRICQFQLSFAQLRAKEFGALSDVAYANGFADQSHFIRSFKEFTETTPKDYLKSGLKKDR